MCDVKGQRKPAGKSAGPHPNITILVLVGLGLHSTGLRRGHQRYELRGTWMVGTSPHTRISSLWAVSSPLEISPTNVVSSANCCCFWGWTAVKGQRQYSRFSTQPCGELVLSIQAKESGGQVSVWGLLVKKSLTQVYVRGGRGPGCPVWWFMHFSTRKKHFRSLNHFVKWFPVWNIRILTKCKTFKLQTNLLKRFVTIPNRLVC